MLRKPSGENLVNPAAVPITAGFVCVVLFYATHKNFLWLVDVLYADVNWHGVLPLLFFVLFFHGDTEFCTS